MVYKQSRVTVRIDYTMREHIAEIQRLKPYAKISVLIRSALRQYLQAEMRKIADKANEAALLEQIAPVATISNEDGRKKIPGRDIDLRNGRRSKKGMC